MELNTTEVAPATLTISEFVERVNGLLPQKVTPKKYFRKILFFLDLAIPSARILPAATCQNHTFTLLLLLQLLLCYTSSQRSGVIVFLARLESDLPFTRHRRFQKRQNDLVRDFELVIMARKPAFNFFNLGGNVGITQADLA